MANEAPCSIITSWVIITDNLFHVTSDVYEPTC